MIELYSYLPNTAYSPESHALEEYFSRSSRISMDLIPASEKDVDVSNYDGEYVRMGFRPAWRKDPRALEIHDYASSSTGTCRSLKNLAKRTLSAKPALRSFLSEEVCGMFNFKDGVPYVLRDMGVPRLFVEAERSQDPSIDLFYAGSISHSRNTVQLIEAASAQGYSILLVGDPPLDIYERFASDPLVEFAGRVGRESIPELAATCRYGVNYTPDRSPYSHQTSTKVLEYLALGLPVLTNGYYWVDRFERTSGARMYRIGPDFGLKNLDTFPYVIPDMTHYLWESVLERSGIEAAIERAFT